MGSLSLLQWILPTQESKWGLLNCRQILYQLSYERKYSSSLFKTNRRSSLTSAYVKSLQSCPTLCNPMAIACQAPLSVGFSKHEHWNGLPCPSLGEHPDRAIKPASLRCPALAGMIFTTSTTWEAPRPSFEGNHQIRSGPPRIISLQINVKSTDWELQLHLQKSLGNVI